MKKKVKIKVVDLYSASTRSVCKVLRYSTRCEGITDFYLHTLLFIRKRNEPTCLCLPKKVYLPFNNNHNTNGNHNGELAKTESQKQSL